MTLRPDKIQLAHQSLQQWRILADRYFEAETTPEEEAQLSRFLLTREGRQPEFDDVRGVMCYFEYNKKRTPIRLHPATRFIRKWAAVVILTIGCGSAVVLRQVAAPDRSLNEMHQVMQGMLEGIDEMTMENQLKEILDVK